MGQYLPTILHARRQQSVLLGRIPQGTKRQPDADEQRLHPRAFIVWLDRGKRVNGRGSGGGGGEGGGRDRGG
eukprot:6731750-Pyramimonas_sp.AAC.1